MMLDGDDDETNVVPSSDEGLPPQRKPSARVLCKVEGEDWGKSIIYNLEPPPKEAPPEIHPGIRKSMRKLMSMSKVDDIQEEPKKFDADADHFSEDDVTAYWCLKFFESSMMATILEDTITQLRILNECNNELRITRTLADMNLHLANKYGVVQPPKVDDLEGIDPNNLNCIKYKLDKLVADRDTLLNVLENLYKELSQEKCFISLLDYVNWVQEQQENAVRLIEEEVKNKLALKEFNKQLRQQRNHHKTVIYDAVAIIANLKSQVEDAQLMTETKSRYVGNWQSARTEQHQHIIFQDESGFTNSTEYFKTRSDFETRVHVEVETLTNIIISETLIAVEEWMAKYERDMEKIELKIQIQKSEYQNMYDKRREMERTYTRHDKEMRAWIRFKEERAAAQLYSDTMTKSAITVQAWWRGLLVRKQLGPFRPKKKKGGGAPKK